jgi:aryl-phospho-beta-D-glucosidase BglC (GH1 family)
VNGEISHGLPPLRSAGNRIVNAGTAELVTLRGVNRSGLEYAEPGDRGFLASAAISRAEIETMVREWGASIIRLPFNQDWALHGRGTFSAESYRQALDNVIAWAAELGAYTLLDLQWLDADTNLGTLPDGSVNRVAPLPNGASIELWAALAERYRDESAVLFDLFNEPHSPLEDHYDPIYFVGEDGKLEQTDPREYDLGGNGLRNDDLREVTADDWNRWAALLTSTIRKIHPASLIFVSGVDWGSDLRGVRVRSYNMDAPNIVYSAHVYPNRSHHEWSRRFGHVCVDRPLFIGEWGGGEEDILWGSRLAAYMNRFACGWTAWSWADFPRLVRDAQSNDYEPTVLGSLVRSELLRAKKVA